MSTPTTLYHLPSRYNRCYVRIPSFWSSCITLVMIWTAHPRIFFPPLAPNPPNTGPHIPHLAQGSDYLRSAPALLPRPPLSRRHLLAPPEQPCLPPWGATPNSSRSRIYPVKFYSCLALNSHNHRDGSKFEEPAPPPCSLSIV